jgi:putative SOS response-associated peptidase YedK
MCGRFTREFTWRQVHDFLNLKFPSAPEMKPSFNIAPTQDIPVCCAGKKGDRELRIMRWGFLPFWSKDATKASINARSETVATSRMFKRSFEQRRCLIPASGFYEWQKAAGGKLPHYIKVRREPVICFAGIWDSWRGGDLAGQGDESVQTVALLTTSANSLVARIHDRMPVILDPRHFDEWLFDKQPSANLFKPFPARRMMVVRVSKRVNSPRNNSRALIEPVEAEPNGPAGLFACE